LSYVSWRHSKIKLPILDHDQYHPTVVLVLMLETPDHPITIEHNGIKHYYQIETLSITFN
jgi:hypothetical protein